MIRLGNIAYSNCYPIHAALCNPERRPPWLRVTTGPPTHLNAMLARGELDVAPCSSIEIARHADRYLALDGVCIGSEGPVDSILLFSRAPLEELDGARVALSRASATSRVLLRILLEAKAAIQPVYRDFDDAGTDPLDLNEAEAALFIGDAALQRRKRPGERVTDLGAAWTEWTGLPFAYALWMIRGAVLDNPELPGLCRDILAARDRAEEELPQLALEAASIFEIDPPRLLSYWRSVRYRYTDAMAEGLQLFLRHARNLDEIPAVPEIRYYRP
jgi:chorismate dehydratase